MEGAVQLHGPEALGVLRGTSAHKATGTHQASEGEEGYHSTGSPLSSSHLRTQSRTAAASTAG